MSGGTPRLPRGSNADEDYVDWGGQPLSGQPLSGRVDSNALSTPLDTPPSASPVAASSSRAGGGTVRQMAQSIAPMDWNADGAPRMTAFARSVQGEAPPTRQVAHSVAPVDWTADGAPRMTAFVQSINRPSVDLTPPAAAPRQMATSLAPVDWNATGMPRMTAFMQSAQHASAETSQVQHAPTSSNGLSVTWSGVPDRSAQSSPSSPAAPRRPTSFVPQLQKSNSSVSWQGVPSERQGGGGGSPRRRPTSFVPSAAQPSAGSSDSLRGRGAMQQKGLSTPSPLQPAVAHRPAAASEVAVDWGALGTPRAESFFVSALEGRGSAMETLTASHAFPRPEAPHVESVQGSLRATPSQKTSLTWVPQAQASMQPAPVSLANPPISQWAGDKGGVAQVRSVSDVASQLPASVGPSTPGSPHRNSVLEPPQVLAAGNVQQLQTSRASLAPGYSGETVRVHSTVSNPPLFQDRSLQQISSGVGNGVQAPAVWPLHKIGGKTLCRFCSRTAWLGCYCCCAGDHGSSCGHAPESCSPPSHSRSHRWAAACSRVTAGHQ